MSCVHRIGLVTSRGGSSLELNPSNPRPEKKKERTSGKIRPPTKYKKQGGVAPAPRFSYALKKQKKGARERRKKAIEFMIGRA